MNMKMKVLKGNVGKSIKHSKIPNYILYKINVQSIFIVSTLHYLDRKIDKYTSYTHLLLLYAKRRNKAKLRTEYNEANILQYFGGKLLLTRNPLSTSGNHSKWKM